MKKKLMVAIDGPASAGKSTVAKILAKKMNYIYVDTGAMYRALTLLSLQEQVDPSSEDALVTLLRRTEISFVQAAEEQRVLLNGSDVTVAIRQDDVTNLTSQVSAHKGVREELVSRQQALAEKGGVVMDGRDIGTAVLPHAQVKIFLVASVEERATRRYKENIAKGIATDYVTLKREIEARDLKDTTRKNSPLVQAKDAVKLDTTGLGIDEVVLKIEQIIKKRIDL